LEVLAKTNIDFEIIIVDDNSPDGTFQIAKAMAEKESAIKAIIRREEKDLGSAVVTGWNAAKGEILGVIDGDFQHPPELIPIMLKKISEDKELDIVIASRNVKGGGVSRWSIWRRFTSCLGTSISHFFLPDILKRIEDPLSGYFILRRKVIQNKLLTPIGYKILLEVLAKGNYKKVEEIPYVFQERKRGGSKAGLRQYLASLVHVWRLSIQTSQIKKIIRLF
jgi:dolichol-phosphate mannosyltransferase